MPRAATHHGLITNPCRVVLCQGSGADGVTQGAMARNHPINARAASGEEGSRRAFQPADRVGRVSRAADGMAIVATAQSRSGSKANTIRSRQSRRDVGSV